MRSRHTAVLVYLAIVLLISPSIRAQGKPRRDASAVRLLESMNAACGWNAHIPGAVIASGIVAQNGKTETVTIEAKPGYLRVDRREAKTVLILHGRAGKLSIAGKIQRLSGGEAASISPLMFPFYTELVDTADPSMAAISGGHEVVAGKRTRIVGLASTHYIGDGRDGARQTSSTMQVAISDDLKPVRVGFQRMAHETERNLASTEAFLSDFRNINGVLVPFRYEERLNHQTQFIMQLQKVSFEGPIPDSDFNLN